MFFIRTVINYDNQLFKGSFRIRSFPNIYYSTPEELFIVDEYEKQNYMDLNFWRITPSDVTIDEAKILEWVNAHRKDSI